LNFTPNWNCRGVLSVLVTRPAVAVSIAVAGALKLGVFVTLKHVFPPTILRGDALRPRGGQHVPEPLEARRASVVCSEW
jgi:hypothetical protein